MIKKGFKLICIFLIFTLIISSFSVVSFAGVSAKKMVRFDANVPPGVTVTDMPEDCSSIGFVEIPDKTPVASDGRIFMGWLAEQLSPTSNDNAVNGRFYQPGDKKSNPPSAWQIQSEAHDYVLHAIWKDAETQTPYITLFYEDKPEWSIYDMHYDDFPDHTFTIREEHPMFWGFYGWKMCQYAVNGWSEYGVSTAKVENDPQYPGTTYGLTSEYVVYVHLHWSDYHDLDVMQRQIPIKYDVNAPAGVTAELQLNSSYAEEYIIGEGFDRYTVNWYKEPTSDQVWAQPTLIAPADIRYWYTDKKTGKRFLASHWIKGTNTGYSMDTKYWSDEAWSYRPYEIVRHFTWQNQGEDGRSYGGPYYTVDYTNIDTGETVHNSSMAIIDVNDLSERKINGPQASEGKYIDNIWVSYLAHEIDTGMNRVNNQYQISKDIECVEVDENNQFPIEGAPCYVTVYYSEDDDFQVECRYDAITPELNESPDAPGDEVYVQSEAIPEETPTEDDFKFKGWIPDWRSPQQNGDNYGTDDDILTLFPRKRITPVDRVNPITFYPIWQRTSEDNNYKNHLVINNEDVSTPDIFVDSDESSFTISDELWDEAGMLTWDVEIFYIDANTENESVIEYEYTTLDKDNKTIDFEKEGLIPVLTILTPRDKAPEEEESSSEATTESTTDSETTTAEEMSTETTSEITSEFTSESTTVTEEQSSESTTTTEEQSSESTTETTTIPKGRTKIGLHGYECRENDYDSYPKDPDEILDPFGVVLDIDKMGTVNSSTPPITVYDEITHNVLTKDVDYVIRYDKTNSVNYLVIIGINDYEGVIAIPYYVKSSSSSGGGGGGGSGGSSSDKAAVIKDKDDDNSSGAGGSHAKDKHYLYITGYPDGTFKPQNNITRAEVATIFDKVLTLTDKTEEFPDVALEMWYHKYIAECAGNNIIVGYPDGTFKPQNSITRAEFVTMVANAFNLSNGENTFNDIDGHWAYKYICAVAEKEWIVGYPDGGFHPNDFITRAEAVTIVNNMLDRHCKLKDDLRFSDVSENHWAFYQILESSETHTIQN